MTTTGGTSEVGATTLASTTLAEIALIEREAVFRLRFFPAAAWLEVSGASGSQCLRSSGLLAHLPPQARAVEGRLLVTGPSGGGPQPFASQTNTLYVRLWVCVGVGGVAISQVAGFAWGRAAPGT